MTNIKVRSLLISLLTVLAFSGCEKVQSNVVISNSTNNIESKSVDLKTCEVGNPIKKELFVIKAYDRRQQPSENSPLIMNGTYTSDVERYDVVETYCQKDDWYKVQLVEVSGDRSDSDLVVDNQVGWVSASHLSETAPSEYIKGLRWSVDNDNFPEKDKPLIEKGALRLLEDNKDCGLVRSIRFDDKTNYYYARCNKDNQGRHLIIYFSLADVKENRKMKYRREYYSLAHGTELQ